MGKASDKVEVGSADIVGGVGSPPGAAEGVSGSSRDSRDGRLRGNPTDGVRRPLGAPPLVIWTLQCQRQPLLSGLGAPVVHVQPER